MCSTVWILGYGSQSIFWRDYYDRNIDCCISGNIGRSNSYYYGKSGACLSKIGILLLAKVIIAIVAGYLVDIFFKKEIAVPHHEGELCHDCGCHNHSSEL